MAADPIYSAEPVFVNASGPLPLNSQFYTPTNGMLLIYVSGSMFAPSPQTMLVMNILMDGQQIGTCQVFANNPNIHMALVPAFIPVPQQQSGTHILTLAAGNGVTDGNDCFNATVFVFTQDQ